MTTSLSPLPSCSQPLSPDPHPHDHPHPGTQDQTKTIILLSPTTPLGRTTALAFASQFASSSTASTASLSTTSSSAPIPAATSVPTSLGKVGKMILLSNPSSSSHLEETRSLILAENPGVEVEWFALDLCDWDAVGDVVEKIGDAGGWDCLVLCEGDENNSELELADGDGGGDGIGERENVRDEVGNEVGEWWTGFEHTLKSTILVTRALLPTRNAGAAIVGLVTADLTSTDHQVMVDSSVDVVIQTALVKLLEVVAAECPDLFVASLQTGNLDTGANRRMSNHEGNMDGRTPIDSFQKTADFAVWMCSPEARFLRGRFVSADWGFRELKAMASRIEADPLFLTCNIVGAASLVDQLSGGISKEHTVGDVAQK